MTRKAVGNLAAAVARMDLAVGAAWLVASRMGMRPIGIPEPIALLTAVHFHFAGFAAAMIASCQAALDHRAEDGSRRTSGKWQRRVSLLVVGMPFLVAAGFAISPALKMGAGVIFALSVAGLAGFMWNSAARDVTARRFIRVAAGSAFAGMIFAGTYAVADFAGSNAVTIPAMASTHGILNGFGFCLLGLLGWLLEWEQRLSPGGAPQS